MNTSFHILLDHFTVTLFLRSISIVFYSIPDLFAENPTMEDIPWAIYFLLQWEVAQMNGFHLCPFMFPFPLLIWLMASWANLRNWGSVDTNRYPQPIICYGITYGFWMLRSRHIGRPRNTVQSWYIGVIFLWGSSEGKIWGVVCDSKV